MAAPQTDKTGQIQAVPKGPPTINDLLVKMGPAMQQALPKHINPDRMMRMALTAIKTNKKLAECTPGSFLGCILQAAQLGLEPNTALGHAYLVPYKRTCTLIIGYQGMIDLARRSGEVSAVYAFPVYEGDEFAYQLGLEPNIKHIPSEDPNRHTRPLTHVYAVAKLKSGEPVFTVLTVAEVEKYRNRSMAARNGPWVTDYEAMALKTAIRRLYRWLPRSAEMATAVALEETVEQGRPQLEAASEEVIGLLQNEGLDTEEETEHGNEQTE